MIDQSKLEKWQAEAREQGWTFERRIEAQSAGYGAYIHDACGRKKEVQIVNMRRGLVRCQHCTEKARRDDAISLGWTFVAHVDKNHALYSHDACGHEQKIHKGSVRKGEALCHGCEAAQWQAEAREQGWTFVAQTDGHNAIYTHDACGHEQEIGLGNMRKNAVRCRHCMEQARHNDATAQGWTFVSQANKASANYIHDACGHEQQIQCGHMRSGYVACHGCGESWATKPSNVYLLDITTACGQRFLKAGIARVVERRAERYGLAEGAKIKVLYAKAYTTGAEACKVEKKLHKNATKIHPSIRKFKGAKKLMDNGHTECYGYSQEAVNYLLFTLQF
jgi:hypothetical protein